MDCEIFAIYLSLNTYVDGTERLNKQETNL